MFEIHRVLMLFGLFLATAVGQAQTITDGQRSVSFTEEVPRGRTGYDSPWQFSHAIRAGDYVYLSGMVLGVPPHYDKPMGAEAFKERAEDLFRYMQRYARSAGAELSGIVKINTFHVENPELTPLDKTEQARLIAEVKKAYVPEPHPAWTAVGTTGLFPPNGLVEIEVVIYSPKQAAAPADDQE